LAASSAALVTLTGTSFDAGVYAVVNNHIAEGFLASADKVIKLHYGANHQRELRRLRQRGRAVRPGGSAKWLADWAPRAALIEHVIFWRLN
jgi:hypothetical protein